MKRGISTAVLTCALFAGVACGSDTEPGSDEGSTSGGTGSGSEGASAGDVGGDGDGAEPEAGDGDGDGVGDGDGAGEGDGDGGEMPFEPMDVGGDALWSVELSGSVISNHRNLLMSQRIFSVGEADLIDPATGDVLSTLTGLSVAENFSPPLVPQPLTAGALLASHAAGGLTSPEFEGGIHTMTAEGGSPNWSTDLGVMQAFYHPKVVDTPERLILSLESGNNDTGRALAALDPTTGVEQWRYQPDASVGPAPTVGAADESAAGLAVLLEGSTYAIGFVDLEDGFELERLAPQIGTWQPRELAMSDAGDLYLLAGTYSTSSTPSRAYIAGLDASGQIAWSEEIAAADPENFALEGYRLFADRMGRGVCADNRTGGDPDSRRLISCWSAEGELIFRRVSRSEASIEFATLLHNGRLFIGEAGTTAGSSVLSTYDPFGE